MRIVRFIKSATQRNQYPESGLPNIAFAGRSNVGKSSLINRLVGRKNLARTSSTPGRTQLINFFSVDDRWMLVDLPGYGFAKVPDAVRAQWAPMIEEYLAEAPNLEMVVAIVDARHAPTELDQQMILWLRSYDIPFQVVATKIDKVSKNRRSKSIQQIKHSLGIENPILFSAVTGEGSRELWKIVEQVN